MPITSTARVGGETPGDADQMALANLLSKIGISAQSTLSVSEEETANNDGLEYKADIKSVLNTYSQATITNTETCSFRDGDKGFYILRYMKRTELEKMFNQRRERVEDYVRSAFRAEEKGRVDDALRFYNWAFIMLHSLQYPGEVRMKIGGEEQLLLNWIPMQVKEILENVEAAVAEIKPHNTIDMLFTY